jgi:two-component system, OmpR family, sensor kinase
MRLPPTTIRARLTLWYTVGLAVPLAAFSVVLYFTFADALRSRTDAFISDAVSVFSRELVSERRNRESIAAAIRATVSEVRFRHLDIVVLDDAGRAVAMSPTDPSAALGPRSVDSAMVVRSLSAVPADSVGSTIDRANGHYRVITHRAFADGERFRVAGIYPLADDEAVLARIRELFLVAIPLLVAAAGAGGWFLARRGLAPVAAITSQAAAIGATNLHERLPVGANDELGALAGVLNDLLDRLERSFAQQRRFMADASHELRTPAAIVRTEADVTLSRERTTDDYRESMTVVQDAARRLTRIVEEIFILARADSGQLVVNLAPVHLEELVHDMVRAVRPVAEHRDVHLDLAEIVDAPATGDPDLLGRVLLNLLDNAIKHSAPGGVVEVRMTRGDRSHHLSVIDHGPGIPDELHERVFERFFRGDTARSRSESSATSGAGLGLPIARRIAELHGGRLELVASRPGHTEFRLTIPA